MTSTKLNIRYQAPSALKPYDRNARKHSKKQVRQIADSISRFGFNNPILVTAAGEMIAGHGRLAAAKLLDLKKVPTLCIDHLSEAERRAFILADNKLALNATWDTSLLGFELEDLGELGIDLSVAGFSTTEVDMLIHAAHDSDPDEDERSAADEVPELAAAAVSRRGEVWELGRHVLVCGDAREPADYDKLMKGERADLIFTDPPWNCAIQGHVSGLGKIKHREFAMAAGEMSQGEFTGFLTTCLSLAAAQCRDGAIAFVFIDWRGIGPLLQAGREAFTEHKQLCVWNKTNGGMGIFYRSKHELIFVFKIGTAPHTNTFGLGDTGRYRTNVWDYPGISSLGANRTEEHERHPTPKPVALVADAIRDCTQRAQIVLDAFGGSGSTLIAAESCGRCARLLELDPLYCDVIIRRYEQYTGKSAILRGDGRSFEDVAVERARELGGVA
jgi:DNA modification methylase